MVKQKGARCEYKESNISTKVKLKVTQIRL